MKVKIIKETVYGTYSVYTKPYWFKPWYWKRICYVSATCLPNAINKANQKLDDLDIGNTYAIWKR